MCGISAIFSKKSVNNSLIIQDMMDRIKSRGDTPTRIKILDNCVLGCNRLAIVDRKRAIQPLVNEKNTVSVVFNGELYNFEELKKELQSEGHKFKTSSDTEVLVHGYEQWGKGLPERLDGQFAFFIYDQKNKEYFAARDRFGIKPLYYAQSKNNTYFASEIKCFIDLNVLTIEYLPPGCYMKNGKISKYYSYSFNNISKEIPFITKKIKDLIDSAVKKRVQTDLPIGIYFSGGIDSAIILKLATKYHKNVTAFCVGTNDSEDVYYAKRFCKEEKIKLIVSNPIEDKILKSLEKYIYIGETFEPNQINTLGLSYCVANQVRKKGIKVALAGEGADEIFAGYSEFKKIENPKKLQAELDRYLKLLHRTQLQRVDRMSMVNTVEVRVPFLDTDLVEFVMAISPELKLKKDKGKIFAKWILRKAFENDLPEYIVWREKSPFPVGAQSKRKEGEIDAYSKLARECLNKKMFNEIKSKYSDYKIKNIEEAFYLLLFLRWFAKAKFNKQRTNMIQR